MSSGNGDFSSPPNGRDHGTSERTVLELSPKLALDERMDELLTAEELAARLRVPESWVRARTRSRTLDQLPCVRLGRYTRFRWRAVEQWLRDHEEQSRG
jgi:excisionase family DNA binding protein